MVTRGTGVEKKYLNADDVVREGGGREKRQCTGIEKGLRTKAQCVLGGGNTKIKRPTL